MPRAMEEPHDDGIIEAMGITRPVYEEMTLILGRLPVIDDISTLLAMWDSNGRQQSLLGWLKGMRHEANPEAYVYSGTDTSHKEIREPRVAECIEIAHSLSDVAVGQSFVTAGHSCLHELLYMVGDVSSLFLDSEYARRCLHLASDPVAMENHEEEREYITVIVDAMRSAGLVTSIREVARGGLFATLVALGGGELGFDILTPREVRLDAFLFGEEPGRFVVSLAEKCDDEFLLKLDEARLNCCFLGRVTKGRVLVDGTDFGPVGEYGFVRGAERT